MKFIVLCCCALFVSACGYKGDLYLPQENDPNQFGVIQTGFEWQTPHAASEIPHTQPPQKVPQ